jgi:hypothetical protein
MPSSIGNGPFAFPVPVDPLKPEKVAIVGTQPSSRMLAPYSDPTWTVWGTSPGNMNVLPRVDAWFETHCNFHWAEYKSYGEPYKVWLQAQKFPVVALTNDFLPRGTIRYPIEHMIERFGTYIKAYRRKVPFWFTSTFSYCMAYAIAVGVKQMALYGVDMSSKDEYALQRPGGQRMLEYAIEAGIDVIIPPESDLLQCPPLYGYDAATYYGRKSAARGQEMKAQMTVLEQQINAAQSQLLFLRGALEDNDYHRNVYGSVDQIAPVGILGGNNGWPVPSIHPERDIPVPAEQRGGDIVGVLANSDATNGTGAGASPERSVGIESVSGRFQHSRAELGPSGPPDAATNSGHGDL